MSKYVVTIERRVVDLLRATIEVEAPTEADAIKQAKVNAIAELQFFGQIYAYRPVCTDAQEIS